MCRFNSNARDIAYTKLRQCALSRVPCLTLRDYTDCTMYEYDSIILRPFGSRNTPSFVPLPPFCTSKQRSNRQVSAACYITACGRSSIPLAAIGPLATPRMYSLQVLPPTGLSHQASRYALPYAASVSGFFISPVSSNFSIYLTGRWTEYANQCLRSNTYNFDLLTTKSHKHNQREIEFSTYVCRHFLLHYPARDLLKRIFSFFLICPDPRVLYIWV